MTPDAHDALTVHLRIGALDAHSTRDLRRVLLEPEDQPGTHLLIDLRQMDDRHDMTLFALLTVKARAVSEAMGRTTAVHPTQRLGHLLATVGVHVIRDLPVIAATERVSRLSVGLMRD